MATRRRDPLVRSKRRLISNPWRRWKAATRLGVRKLSRLRASPHEIALGCALGAFASVTPLLGIQTLMAVVLAMILRVSVPAAIIGTFLGNPLSWPFIWASTYAMGLHLVGFEGVFDPTAIERNMLQLWAAVLERSPQVMDATAALLWPLLWPMLAGSIPIGLLTAAVVYYISRNVVRAWRDRSMPGMSTAAE